MTDRTQNPLQSLEVLDFEVHAVYGAHLDIPPDPKSQQRWTNWFERLKREKDAVREQWTPIYRDHCSTITVDVKTPDWCDKIEVEHPKFFRRGELANQHTPSPITMGVSRRLTVRKDGAAAVTIRLKADKRETRYDLADILAPLLLTPRILSGSKLHPDIVTVNASEAMATTTSEVYRPTANAEQNTSNALLDRLATDDRSAMFRLFLGALKEVVSDDPHPNWCEYRASGTPEQTQMDPDGGAQLPPDILPWVGDQQIPCFVVFATLPKRVYDDAFLEMGADFREEKLASRQGYTRLLAAILLRWLSPHNANFISIDFLESLGLLRNGIFVYKYMNSLSFVTYSSTGTLCLKPERQGEHGHEELDPQEATYGSIIRCVELSRLRWHHALRLNRLLDELTGQVIGHDGVKGFEDYLAGLLTIRAEAALHFLDPLTYQWDATVGADIARFLQIDVIERIEKECLQKLDMVKELIHEKLDVLRARAMQGVLRRK